MRLYNSLTKQVEDFRPADPSRITFYTCGPTVYDFAHIGNFRSFLMADVLRRWLESPLCEILAPDGSTHKGPREVVHVMNITDVGHMTEDENLDGAGVDRMEEGGRRVLEMKKAGKLPPGAPADLDASDPRQIAAFYAGAFLEDARLLGLKVAQEAEKKPALMPRPTEKIAQMQAMIRDLLAKGLAYVVGAPGAAGTAVYFDVRAYDRGGGNYGALSGNTLDRLRAGAGGRVSSENQAGKRDPADFMLWKVDPAHRMKWDFEGVGAGYPGWHIECSAMAREALGDTIDLHSGGEDNIFPHHECEIAQSRAATGLPVFARHWLHVRHLMVEGAKMSKSKGNFYTIRDIARQSQGTISPAALRLELIKTHYRSNANFTTQGLRDSERMVERWRAFVRRAAQGSDAPSTWEVGAQLVSQSMSDDLNIAGAIGAWNAWIDRNPNPSWRDGVAALSFASMLLGQPDIQQTEWPDEYVWASGADERINLAAQATDWKTQIDAARASKNYAESDRLRAEAEAAGYEVRMSKEGATVTKRAGL